MKLLLRLSPYLLFVAAFASAALPDRCSESLFPPYEAKIAKTRDDETKIYELKAHDARVYFYKENSNAESGERRIFDDLGMAALAVKFANKTGLGKFLPETVWRTGVIVKSGGHVFNTRAGVPQAGIPEIITPIDDFKRLHPDATLNSAALQDVLNSGDWPRLYADWKIFWNVLNQVDLNIANLARSGSQIMIFDLGDVMNLPGTRARMGVHTAKEANSFGMPGNPADLAEHRPDFRRADPEFKEFVRIVAHANDEKLASFLDESLDHPFILPRGRVREHVLAMRVEALRVLPLLDKAPFD